MYADFAIMENKTMIAVLLSLTAAAGLAATDAYAQSNSERIAAIDARTSDIEDTADDISDSVGSLATVMTAVQTALADLAAAIQSIAFSMSDVQASVDGMAGDISAINSKISDVDSAMAGIAAIDDRMAGMEGQLATLQVSVNEIDAGGDATTARDLADINSRLAGMDSRLAGMDSRLATTNQHISEALARLSNIEAALQITNQKIDRPAVIAPPPPTNALRDGETELNVNTHHYLRHGDATTDRGPHYYELDMAFSCNKNVFLDTVDLVPVLNIGDRLDHVGVSSDNDPNDDGNTLPDAGDGKPVAATNNNYVKVDGRDLYNNAFHTGANTFAELDVPLQFNNKLLRAGETLRFTSMLYDGLFRTIVDDTKYTVPRAALPVRRDFRLGKQDQIHATDRRLHQGRQHRAVRDQRGLGGVRDRRHVFAELRRRRDRARADRITDAHIWRHRRQGRRGQRAQGLQGHDRLQRRPGGDYTDHGGHHRHVAAGQLCRGGPDRGFGRVHAKV